MNPKIIYICFMFLQTLEQANQDSRQKQHVSNSGYEQSAGIGRSTSCHNNLDDVMTSTGSFPVDSRRRPFESRSLDNLDCDDRPYYDKPDGPKKCDDKVYVAGNVSSPYKPLTINTKNVVPDAQSYDTHPTMHSPRNLPRLRLPMYSEVQQEANYSPNVLRSPRELNFEKSEDNSPLSPSETEKFSRSPKEWYESNLDSPLPVRRHISSRVSSPMSDLLTTVQQIGESSPPSPHKVESSSAAYSPPLINPRSPTEFETKQIISVGHFKPYHEEVKPYETADFYKYSRKHRNKSSGSDNSDMSIAASPSQVLQQVAENVLMSSVMDRGYRNEAHVYEPISVQCMNSGVDQDQLSPQSVSHYRPPKPMTHEALNLRSMAPHAIAGSTNVSLQHASPVSPHLANRFVVTFFCFHALSPNMVVGKFIQKLFLLKCKLVTMCD